MGKAQRRRERRKSREDWPILFPGKKPRVRLDANLPQDFVEALASRGVDASHAATSPARGRGDKEEREEASQTGRYFITCDSDFWDDLKHPLKASPGVIILDTGSKQDWTRALTLLLGFVDYLKTFVRGPGAGDILLGSKIRLTRDRIVWRMLDFHSLVVTQEEAWGP